MQNAGPKPLVSKHVLDSSVILAVLLNERFDSDLLVMLEGSTMSSVKYAEVWTKVHQLGISQSRHIDRVFALLDRVEPFTESQARIAGGLHAATRHAGLSLGDRACLALTLQLGAQALTTDKAWARIDVGCPIRFVR